MSALLNHSRNLSGLPGAPLVLALAMLAAPANAASGLSVTLTDGNGKPVPGAVVYLTSPAAATAVKPLENARITQKNKMFLPDVLVVTTGTPVAFPNEDTVRHHVYSFSSAKKFEIKLYVGTPSKPVVFDTPGVVVLGCNIHDHMVAWVVVVDTPYFGRTNDDGELTLPAAPAGDYTLRAWHHALPVGNDGVSTTLSLSVSPGHIDLAVPDLALP